MRKFLSIIIPRFKERENDIFPLLSSINNQIGIDFSDIEVIISNDGDCAEKISDDFLGLFQFDVKQVFLEENKGPGVTRQIGLDDAIGEYVMFCDADDILHNVTVLDNLMSEAEKEVPDIMSSSWMEEMIENGKHFYITHENENTWMHGKIIRRQFLLKNGIRFHDTLRVHEDSYFLSIAQAFSKNSRYMPIASYIWKFKDDSITRRNGGVYLYESMPEFIRSCTLSFKIVREISPEQMPYKIIQFIFYNYFTLHNQLWIKKENGKYLKEAENAFVKYVKPFWKYWTNTPDDFKAEVYNVEREKLSSKYIEKETVEEWLKRIELQ